MKRTAGNVCVKALPARSKLKRCLPGGGGAYTNGEKAAAGTKPAAAFLIGFIGCGADHAFS